MIIKKKNQENISKRASSWSNCSPEQTRLFTALYFQHANETDAIFVNIASAVWGEEDNPPRGSWAGECRCIVGGCDARKKDAGLNLPDTHPLGGLSSCPQIALAKDCKQSISKLSSSFLSLPHTQEELAIAGERGSFLHTYQSIFIIFSF